MGTSSSTMKKCPVGTRKSHNAGWTKTTKTTEDAGTSSVNSKDNSFQPMSSGSKGMKGGGY